MQPFGKCDECGKQGYLTEIFIVPNVTQSLCEGCIQEWRQGVGDEQYLKSACPRCGGSGLSWGDDCDYCDGHGFLWWE